MALLSLSFLYTLSLKMFSVDFVLLFTPFTVTILSHRYRKLLFTDFLMILPVSSQNPRCQYLSFSLQVLQPHLSSLLSPHHEK